MSKKIIISGSEGQLGKTLQQILSLDKGLRCFFYPRKKLDITDASQLEKVFVKIKPDYFINAAAYTSVDKAETEIEKCFLINDFALHSISTVCENHNTRLIHISSDYVYHLKTDEPLKEDSPTLPRGIYAQSKLAGELKITASTCQYIILRTSWVYSTHGHNFIKTVLRLAKEREQMNVVNDQIGTLTSTVDISRAILTIIHSIIPDSWNQIYNYSNEGVTNWYEIADYIVSSQNLSLGVNPIPSTDYPTPAERPKWSVLNKEKIKKTFGLEIPHWKLSLDKCLKELLES